MNARNATAVMVLLMLATLAASLILYPHLPDQLPIHWNWLGQPDSWADKSHAAYLMPNVIGACLILMHLLSRLSPKHLAIEPFAKTYYYIFVVIAGLMAHIHVVMLLCGLAPEADYSRLLLSGLFLFMGLMGNVLGKVRRNLWMGIRTPWTLASDAVWIATHRLAARLLFLTGIVSTIAVLLGVSPVFGLVLFGVAFLLPIVESYRLYQKLKKE